MGVGIATGGDRTKAWGERARMRESSLASDMSSFGSARLGVWLGAQIGAETAPLGCFRGSQPHPPALLLARRPLGTMASKRIQLAALLGVALVASCSAARTLQQSVTPEPDEQEVNGGFTQAQQDALTATINGDSSHLIGDQSDRGNFVQVGSHRAPEACGTCSKAKLAICG